MNDGAKKNLKRAAVLAVALVMIGAGIAIVSRPGEEKEGYSYSPTIALPQDYMVFVEEPGDVRDLAFIATTSSIAVRDTYKPFFILGDEGLDQHQLWTIQHHELIDAPKIFFLKDPDSVGSLLGQLDSIGSDTSDGNVFVYQPSDKMMGEFKGFADYVSVGSYKEATWVAPLAHHQNKVMVLGGSTYPDQGSVWVEMQRAGMPADYLAVCNPSDFTEGSYRAFDANDTKTFSEYDEHFHIPALSAMTPFLAAYRGAYVMTDYDSSTDTSELFDVDEGKFDIELNARAIGLYRAILGWVQLYGVPEYIGIVGSAAAVPQFQMPDTTTSDDSGEADSLVNSDVMYGFTHSDDRYMMYSAVGRLVNLNVQGLSNQLTRTFNYEQLAETVDVEYSDGTHTTDWRNYGSAFSGYQITYQRRQATPARYVCRDYDDESMEYEYYGPAGIGSRLLPGDRIIKQVTSTRERDLEPILEASGFVAYRGHGSHGGTMYMVPYLIGDEEAVLRSEEAALLDLPPQVAQFVACENGKIHGGGWNDEAPIDITRSFALNYIYGGAVGYCGATEVSYSNPGQDSDAATGEVTGNHYWDANDAWFAFFWDSLLNHEEDHGSIGKAVQWAENRYIHNPNHDFQVSPFIEKTTESDWYSVKGMHWKEVTMFAAYGDPAFRPHISSPGENQEDPWHNGDGEGMGLP